MRKRLAIWEIFMAYMRDGARSWPEVQQSLTKEDFDKIVAICDGVPLRDLLLGPAVGRGPRTAAPPFTLGRAARVLLLATAKRAGKTR